MIFGFERFEFPQRDRLGFLVLSSWGVRRTVSKDGDISVTHVSSSLQSTLVSFDPTGSETEWNWCNASGHWWVIPVELQNCIQLLHLFPFYCT